MCCEVQAVCKDVSSTNKYSDGIVLRTTSDASCARNMKSGKLGILARTGVFRNLYVGNCVFRYPDEKIEPLEPHLVLK